MIESMGGLSLSSQKSAKPGESGETWKTAFNEKSLPKIHELKPWKKKTLMIQDYLKAGFPALCLLTQEPDRAEQTLPCEGGVQFYSWDCIRGIRPAKRPQTVDEIRDPVEAVKWLDGQLDTVLIAHNLHLFLDIPEVVQAIQNGVIRWKAIGSCLVMVAPVIQKRPELEKINTVIDLELPNEENLFHLQMELANPGNS